jgi:hypothetical protein
MASSSSTHHQNNREIDSASSISVIRSSERLRGVSRENHLLHRTRSGGVDHSPSPAANRRKPSTSGSRPSETAPAPSPNAENRADTSDDTDEDVNQREKTSSSFDQSSRLSDTNGQSFSI